MSFYTTTKPIEIPKLVEVQLTELGIAIKGPLGSLFQLIDVHNTKIEMSSNYLTIQALNSSKQARSIVGTINALISNMIRGVTNGFEKKLLIVGVGYKAQVSGNILNLNLGFSHPISYSVPEDIKVETPNPTEILIKGIDKQKVGQVAADVRSYRRPEPYKGKGIRYFDEKVIIKETKKK
ncbi:MULTISPECIES: 50S ribosomal protein L6 [Nitrosomonas]|uniref:Large ribosomal subunit protein uL6 n=2 Tax=Nitrosomonas eutropha TaxID=916 RepID=A0ABX5M9E5_9PROT|nr:MULTISPECIES: 50S ribosomal protein L6 [Nitrosomonas]ABI58845.1 LSU ribosomal protein L6P [Nitrosomonas eutropha C91]PXV80573.1 LSU ribosomal protein L6P [Nitrosomonas eutropha]SCX04453.1 LSU ribosomal protein L6P [Nitrosomonas eutropha]SDW45354.1 LSU ribosomal protein L6P [Nitrosomonas eutropha]SEI87560.1 LSU ribosomal protein L6P [Nitrosomonas eutropha]